MTLNTANTNKGKIGADNDRISSIPYHEPRFGGFGSKNASDEILVDYLGVEEDIITVDMGKIDEE